jgi:hypothetical protein
MPVADSTGTDSGTICQQVFPFWNVIIFILFIYVYSLFNDTVSNCEYTSPNGRMISE